MTELTTEERDLLIRSVMASEALSGIELPREEVERLLDEVLKEPVIEIGLPNTLWYSNDRAVGLELPSMASVTELMNDYSYVVFGLLDHAIRSGKIVDDMEHRLAFVMENSACYGDGAMYGKPKPEFLEFLEGKDWVFTIDGSPTYIIRRVRIEVGS